MDRAAAQCAAASSAACLVQAAPPAVTVLRAWWATQVTPCDATSAAHLGGLALGRSALDGWTGERSDGGSLPDLREKAGISIWHDRRRDGSRPCKADCAQTQQPRC